MRVERGGSDGSRAITEKARIRLEIGDWLAGVDVEDLYAMLLSSTTIVSFTVKTDTL
jgi:hypothetical protein